MTSPLLGQRKGLAGDGLTGLQYFLPACAGRLKQSWKLVTVWQRVEPLARVLPLSPLLLLGVWRGGKTQTDTRGCGFAYMF